MEKDRGPERVCLVEDTSKTTEVGPAWHRAAGQKGLVQAAQRAEHVLPAQGSQALGQGKCGNPRAQRLRLGAAENWALVKALRRQKVCHPGAFLAPCFVLPSG